MPRIALLLGRSGSGKTVAGALTAPKKPVILIDADRKAKSTSMLEPAIKSGDLTILEITEPLAPGRLDHRVIALSQNKKPIIPPTGWVQFATLVEDLFAKANRPGGTLMIDSWTQLNDHLKRFIIYHDNQGHATLNDRNWGTFLNMNVEAIVALKDACAKTDMDLIVTVHEKTTDIPTKYTTTKRVAEAGVSRVVREGIVQSLIAPSIDGQFGVQMPAYFAEAYQCFVEASHDGVPVWRMRIKPDGIRDLRTSIDTPETVVEPDLSKLWKGGE
jgi:hypothetical protein